MNSLFKKRESNFLIQLFGLSILLYGIHTYLNFHFLEDVILFFPLWHIYVFHIITVVIIYSLINYRESIGKTDVFNAFILGMLLKMVLTIIFLLPWILSKPDQKGFDLANFFIPYFIFLAFEVYAITRILKKK